MKQVFFAISILVSFLMLTEHLSAQSAIGGPRKQTALGGPVPVTNPVVARQKGNSAAAMSKNTNAAKR
jgi:hypothetical protein